MGLSQRNLFVMRRWLAILLVLGATACQDAVTAGNGDTTSSGGTTGDGGSTTNARPWIDTHAHPVGTDTSCTTAACIASAVAIMDSFDIKKTIFMHPPSAENAGNQSKEANVSTVVGLMPDRFFYGGGGSTLNSVIQGTPESGPVSAEVKQSFTETAQALVAAGAVVFGETTALHFSMAKNHSFEETLPNTELFKHLADLAAQHGIPVDLHIDVVITTMDTPTFFASIEGNHNPPQVQANVAAFEELLSYKREAKIVLAHVGRDTTGDMSAALMAKLLEAHSNLYLQISPVFGPLKTDTAIVDTSFQIRSEWLDLLKAYPDRFVLGSDAFYSESEDSSKKALVAVDKFLNRLPADLAYQIGCSNPVAIYGLSSGC